MKIQKKVTSAIYSTLFYLLLALGGVCVLQSTVDITIPYELLRAPVLLGLNLCIVIGVLFFLTALWQRKMPVFLSYTSLVILLYVINKTKIRETDEPFIPTDLLRITEPTFLLRYLNTTAIICIIIAVVFLVVTVIVAYRSLPSWKNSLSKCGISLLLTLLILTPPIHQALPGTFDTFDPNFDFWDPKGNAVRRGVLFSSLQFARYLKIQKPKYYDPTKLREKLATYKVKHTQKKPVESVVVLLVESLWDPTLAGIPFQSDPMPNFRDFFSKNFNWNIVGNVFGGNTTNTSFEVLTGLSTAFFPENANIFQQYIFRPIGGLPWVFRKQGGQTLFLHNNWATFWSRNRVMPLLGFERFLSLSEITVNFPTDNHMGTDKPLFDAILHELKSTPDAQFIATDTLAMHGPYAQWNQPEFSMHFVNPENDVAHEALLAFANKLHHVDREFADFRASLSALEKPVRLVVFGDHQPTASLPYVGKELTAGGYFPKFKVMLSIEQKGESLESYPFKGRDISFNCIAPVLARLLKLSPNPVLKYIFEMCKRQPLITRALLRDEANATFSAQNELLYDSVFGEGVTQESYGITLPAQ